MENVLITDILNTFELCDYNISIFSISFWKTTQKKIKV